MIMLKTVSTFSGKHQWWWYWVFSINTGQMFPEHYKLNHEGCIVTWFSNSFQVSAVFHVFPKRWAPKREVRLWCNLPEETPSPPSSSLTTKRTWFNFSSVHPLPILLICDDLIQLVSHKCLVFVDKLISRTKAWFCKLKVTRLPHAMYHSSGRVSSQKLTSNCSLCKCSIQYKNLFIETC